MNIASSTAHRLRSYDWQRAALDRLVSLIGFRPEMINKSYKLLMQIGGIDSQLLRSALKAMDELDDWPHAWEQAGEQCLLEGQYEQAYLSFYTAQRPLLSGDLKHRLYQRAIGAYHQVPRAFVAERVYLDSPDGVIACLLQVPYASQCVPCVVMVPGITATKEEMDIMCEPLLRRGVAVLRVDNPGGFGETEGLLHASNVPYLRHVIAHAASDDRIDADSIHVVGMSMGGLLALHALINYQTGAKSVITVGAPCTPHRLYPKLKRRYKDALMTATGLGPHALLDGLQDADLAPRYKLLGIPHVAVHGKHDRIVKPSEGKLFAGMGARLVNLDATHACLEQMPELLSIILEQAKPPLIPENHSPARVLRTIAS